MTVFSENDLLTVALILDEEEREKVVEKNSYGMEEILASTRHRRKDQQKGNI